MGVTRFDYSSQLLQLSVGKYVIPTKNMHTQTIDNANKALVASLGGVLGNRQDAVVRKMVPVMEAELAEAA